MWPVPDARWQSLQWHWPIPSGCPLIEYSLLRRGIDRLFACPPYWYSELTLSQLRVWEADQQSRPVHASATGRLWLGVGNRPARRFWDGYKERGRWLF